MTNIKRLEILINIKSEISLTMEKLLYTNNEHDKLIIQELMKMNNKLHHEIKRIDNEMNRV